MKDANESISTNASSNRNSAVSHMFLLWSNDFAKVIPFPRSPATRNG
jgi:hypothetical protein